MAGALTAGVLPAQAATPTPAASAGTGATGSQTPKSGPTGLGSSKAKPGASAAPAGARAAESAAAAKARATGKPVVVDADTTETTQVTAQPGGGFQLVSNSMPVRVKQNGAWRAIDLDLARTGPGWAPIASATDPVVFSAGGTGPLVTETDLASGKHISVSWPGALPAPVIDGDTATYAAVLPGVDLQVQATDAGYHEVLIVHDAAAAADPGLKTLTFKVTGDNGVSFAAGPHGALRVNTAKGTALTAAQPMAWDSTPAGSNMPAPGPDQVGSTAHLTAIPTTSTGSGTQATLTLSPDAAGSRTPIVYPYYIDPSISPTSAHYYEIASFGANWPNSSGPTSLTAANGNKSPWNSELELGVCSLNCYYSWNGNGYTTYTDRDFFYFDTSSLGAASDGSNPTIYSASFSDHINAWGRSGTCDSSTVDQMDLYGTSATPTSSSSWPGPTKSVLSSNGSTDCAGNAPGFNALGAGGVCAGCTHVSLALAANDENPDNAANYWLVSDSATLTVSFDFPVQTPTGLSISDEVNCQSASTSAIYTSDPEPTLSAKATDDNPTPLPVDLWFEVWNPAGTTKESWNTATVQANSGVAGSWTTNDNSSLPLNNEFRVRAQSTGVPSGQAAIYSGYSAWFPFTVLNTAPSALPTVTSFDYPNGQWGQPTGALGTFTLGTNGASNIAGFAYSFDGGSGSEPAVATNDCAYTADGGLGNSVGNAGKGPFGNTTGELSVLPGSTTSQIRIPSGLSAGLHSLYVQSFDYAHNKSPETKYVFYVPANYQQATVIENGDTLTTSGTNASELTDQGACCSITWNDGKQLFFVSTTADQSFSVTFNVAQTGYQHLGANLTTGPDYGQYRVDLDSATSGPNYGIGNTASEPFDGYTSTVSLTYADLGTPYLLAGTHTLTFTNVGTNTASSSYRFGIDYLTVSPTTIYDGYTNSVYTDPANEDVRNSSATAGTVQTQTQDSVHWLNDKQLFWSNTVDGDSLSIQLNAPVDSDYAIGVGLTEADDYGNLRFDIADAGQPVLNLGNTGNTPVANNLSYVSNRYVFLGGVHLKPGPHTLLVTMQGTNSTTGNMYNAGISYLQFAPVTGATETSFTAAMNNHGIVSDGSTPTSSFDMTGGSDLSLQALEAVGITPGTTTAPGNTFTLDGATYTMPQLRSDSQGTYDNVIADGQTIPITVPSGSGPITGVGLLVTSTCAGSPRLTPTVTYTSGQPSQASLPPIPDWTGGTKTNAAVTMAYRDSGSPATADSAHQPSLWAVTVPTNPNQVPNSITLPETTGTTFFSNGCSPLLHVLAIGLASRPAAPSSSTAWVGAYAAPMDSQATLPTGSTSTGLTLSEVIDPSEVYPTASPDDIMLRLSDADSTTPAAFDAVTVAVQGSAGGNTTAATPTAVTFDGKAGTTLWPGATTTSDAIALPAGYAAGDKLVVSMHLTGASYTASTNGAFHTDPDALTYYSAGNTATAQTTTASASVPGSFFLDEADVTDPTRTAGTIAVLGDQYATNAPGAGQNDWVDDLPGQFAASGVTVPGAITNASQNGVTIYDNGGNSQSSAAALYDDVVASEPGLRDVIVSLGANDILAIPTTTTDAAAQTLTLENELTRLVTHVESVSDARTGNYVQVALTTIPPLGLSATDVREQVREQLNTWIDDGNGDFGTTATYWANTATSVTDSSNPQNIAASYLTNGVPNAAYYTEIAYTISGAIDLAETGIVPQPLASSVGRFAPAPVG